MGMVVCLGSRVTLPLTFSGDSFVLSAMIIQVQWNPAKTSPYLMKSQGITNYIFGPGKITVKCMEQRCNEPWYNEILVVTNTIQRPKVKICPDITNKCHHASEVEYKTDLQ